MKATLYIVLMYDQERKFERRIGKKEVELPCLPPVESGYLQLTEGGYDGYKVVSSVFGAHDGSVSLNLELHILHEETFEEFAKEEGWDIS